MTEISKTQDGVVLLHGIARSAVAMKPLAKALQAEGYEVLNLDYPSRTKSLPELAEALAPAIAAFNHGRSGRLHFVGHSMGGLVARAYVTRYRPANLGRMVHLGTPNQGSEVADFIKSARPYRWFFGPAGQELVTTPNATTLKALGDVDYPLGVIAGRRSWNLVASWLLLPGANDGRVSVARSCHPAMTDHVVLPVTHTFMLRNACVKRQMTAFLRHGAFYRP